MKLSDAYNILYELTKSKDNARCFKVTYTWFQHEDNLDLKTYLDFISDNCKEWLERLPDEYNSQPSLAKPKTAVIKLIEQPQVIQAIGADFCAQLTTTITTTWKANKDRIAAQRTIPDSLTETSTPHEDDQELPDENHQEQSSDNNSLQEENLKLVAECHMLKQAIFKMAETCYPEQKEVWNIMKQLFLR